ncbi:MAG TPA: L-rhamnose/proton symporter RhaT [Candidatus Xenobia bacterium]
MTGLVLLLAAGVMNATFALPMKFTKQWSWENTWLVWSILALLVLPPIMGFATVPGLGGVYHQAPPGLVLKVALCGAGWGVAQVLFGLALDIIGIALTFSIVLGLSAAMGSLIPLVSLHPDEVLKPAGLTALAGIGLVVAGVAICAVAGRMREEAHVGKREGSIPFGRGLAIAITSGLCASMMNVGVAFGGPLTDAATAAGAASYWTVNAIWVPLLLGGAIPNVLYCVYLLRRNGTASKYGEYGTETYWFLAFVMACFWFGSSLLYGASIVQVGAVLGWPLFMSLIVILSSLLGVATGEWKAAGPKPLRIQMSGVLVLVLAVIVLSRASL